MEQNIKTRAPGKPKASDPPLQHMEATPAFVSNASPCVICPWCKRGGQARILRGRKMGSPVLDCACAYCGRTFGAAPFENHVPMRWVLTIRDEDRSGKPKQSKDENA